MRNKKLKRVIAYVVILAIVGIIFVPVCLVFAGESHIPEKPRKIDAHAILCEPPSEPETTVIEFTDILDVAEEIAPPETTEPVPTEPAYSEDDLEILAKVMCYEAGGTSEENLLMVGCVIKNRVNHERYPDTYYGVVTQPGQYGNLSELGPFWPQWTDESYRDYCRDLAKQVLANEYTCPDDVIFQAQFVQGSGVYKIVDDHYFCYA